jgi:hypothetical protein
VGRRLRLPALRGVLPVLAGVVRRPAPRVLLVYLVLAVALFHSTWSSPRTSWVGICCDAEQTTWFLRWTPYAIAHGSNPWFSDHLNYPDGVNLLWQTMIFLPSLLLAPVTLTLGPVIAYNVFITFGVALSAWCAYLAIHRYVDRRCAAIFGGLVYGFSPYMLTQSLDHANLVFAPLPPLLLMVIDETLVRRRRSPTVLGVALGVLAACQLLSGEEMLVDEVIAAAILVAVLAWIGRKHLAERAEAAVTTLAVGVPTFLLLCLWPLSQQLFGRQRVLGTLFPTDVFVTDALNFVVPTEVQLIAPARAVAVTQTFTGLGPEFNGYLGIPLLLLLGFAAVRLWSRPVVRAATITAAALAVLSLGPHLHIGGRVAGIPLPWLAVSRIPFMDHALPNRLMLPAVLAVAVIVAVFADTFVDTRSLRASVPGLLAVAVVVVPLLPTTSFPRTDATVPEFFAEWDRSGVPDGSVVLVAPFIRDGGEADPMLWSAVADIRFRMPQGFFFIPGRDGMPQYGAIPTIVSDAMEQIQEKGTRIRFAGKALLLADQAFRERRVETVVVGPMSNRDSMVDFFTALLGRAPESTAGVEIWRHVDQRGVDLSGS